MALVDITGNAWTHAGQPIPWSMHPELHFRPVRNSVTPSGLLAGVEAKADLLPSGAFTIKVESAPDIAYRPVLRWVTNPSEQRPERWAWQSAEWPFWVVPGEGGPVADLVDNFPPGTAWADYGPPAPGATNVLWVDLLDQTDDGVLLYAPARS